MLKQVFFLIQIILMDTGLIILLIQSNYKEVFMEEFLKQVEIIKTEYDKFTQGNKSAGTRARIALQKIKKLAQEIRIEIQNKKKEA